MSATKKSSLPSRSISAKSTPIDVAHVEIGEAVVVDVAERSREPPIQRRSGQRPALFIPKPPAGPGHRREVPLAIVEVKLIGFAVLLHLTVDDEQSILEL